MVTNLSAQEFTEKHSTSPGAVLIDVRDPIELITHGHLDGAINIPLNSDFLNRILLLDKTKPVFVYCAMGRRSWDASVILFQFGFQEVYNLSGGFLGMRKQG